MYDDTLGFNSTKGEYVTQPNRLIRFTFKIQHLYKGQIKQATVSISTSGGGADCGYNFSDKGTYLIYSRQTDSLPNDFRENYRRVTPYWTTSICTRTKRNRFITVYEKAILTIL
jgi:hypothetical protein